jgi:hypothetical protein
MGCTSSKRKEERKELEKPKEEPSLPKKEKRKKEPPAFARFGIQVPDCPRNIEIIEELHKAGNAIDQGLVRDVIKAKLSDSLQFILSKEPGFARAFWQENIDCRGMLHHAVLHGNKECVKLLVDAGADINQGTSKYESGIAEEGGWTPLDLAVYYKHEDMREYLEAKGARGTGKRGMAFCGTDAPKAP